MWAPELSSAVEAKVLPPMAVPVTPLLVAEALIPLSWMLAPPKLPPWLFAMPMEPAWVFPPFEDADVFMIPETETLPSAPTRITEPPVTELAPDVLADAVMAGRMSDSCAIAVTEPATPCELVFRLVGAVLTGRFVTEPLANS